MRLNKKQPFVNNTQPEICSICGMDYWGIGNNAEPINCGRCCDWCEMIVLARRINDLKRVMLERSLLKAPQSPKVGDA